MHRSLFFALAVALGAVLCASPSAHAQCGGICFYEVGTPDAFLAGAGAGARAQDAGTIWFNPAGMTLLDDAELILGGTLLIMDQEFDVSSDTVSPDANPRGGGNAGIVVPLAGSYFTLGQLGTSTIGRNLRLGLAFNIPYGGGWNYDGDWAGRTFVTQLVAAAINIQPSAAYRVIDWLSVGGGVNIYYFNAIEELRAGTGRLAPTIKVENADDWLVAGTIGLMFHLGERTRLGVTHKTHLKLHPSGKLDNSQETIEAEATLPKGVNVSFFRELTPKVALLADAGWSDYSELEYENITLGSIGRTIDRNWQDTWRIGAGVQFQRRETTRLSGGVSYDSDPIRSASQRLPDFPVADALRFALGGQHDFNEHVSMGLGYTLGWWISNDIDQVALPGGVVLDGEYNPNFLHLINASLNLAF